MSQPVQKSIGSFFQKKIGGGKEKAAWQTVSSEAVLDVKGPEPTLKNPVGRPPKTPAQRLEKAKAATASQGSASGAGGARSGAGGALTSASSTRDRYAQRLEDISEGRDTDGGSAMDIVFLAPSPSEPWRSIDMTSTTKPSTRRTLTNEEKMFVKSSCHIWGADKTHIGWNTAATVARLIDELIPDMNLKTVSKYLTDERKEYEDGKGVRTPVGLANLVGQAVAKAKAPGISQFKCDDSFATDAGRPVLFPKQELDALKRLVLTLKGTVGFGERTVFLMAKVLLKKKLVYLPEAMRSWVPSYSWAYNFLTSFVDLRRRRITGKGKRVSPEQQAKTQELKLKLFQSIALDVLDGVLPALIVTSDEFGVHLFPQNDYTYDHRGAKEVLMEVNDDKRQITGNLAVAGNGNLVGYQLIFGGKTKKVLPKPESLKILRDTIKRINPHASLVEGFSGNHWSNLEQKKKLVVAIVEYRKRVLDGMIEQGLLSQNQAEGMPVVVVLDVWPVNTSDAFREWVFATYPFVRLRYIVAGETGDDQIGDTHLHAPAKKMICRQAEEWYQTEMEKLIGLRESFTISDGEYDTGVSKLLSLPVLREELCSWHSRMLEELFKKDDNGQTLVRRAFNDEGKWGLCFQQSFQATAAARRDAVSAEEQAVLSDAVIAARIDPASAAGFAPADIPPSLQVNNVMVAGKVFKKAAEAAAKASRTDFVGDQTQRTLRLLQQEKASGDVTSYGDGGAKDRDKMSSFTEWTMKRLWQGIPKQLKTDHQLKKTVMKKGDLVTFYRDFVHGKVFAAAAADEDDDEDEDDDDDEEEEDGEDENDDTIFMTKGRNESNRAFNKRKAEYAEKQKQQRKRQRSDRNDFDLEDSDGEEDEEDEEEENGDEEEEGNGEEDEEENDEEDGQDTGAPLPPGDSYTDVWAAIRGLPVLRVADDLIDFQKKSGDVVRPNTTSYSKSFVGLRVKWLLSASTVDEQFDGFTYAQKSNAGGAALYDFHGIVRGVKGRNYLVQWFGPAVSTNLYELPAASFYFLLKSEIDLNVERKFHASEPHAKTIARR
jgi:hypothetical protein